ncbi:MAG: 1-deoxy-D-xylulose-5-phosphate synthase, partial [Nitrospirae bacterium]|nr:1-deoxy-D-xylulose-5-phosphate synthase [Nitrospirota bacterium]
ERDLQIIPIGKAEVLRDGNDILITAIGSSVLPAINASRLLEDAGISACVVNARFAKPLDTDLLGSLAKEIKRVLTVEENTLEGGFGSAVLECLTELNIDGLKIKRLGLPDKFIEHGSQKILRNKLGLDAEGIAKAALLLVGKRERVLKQG